MKKDWKEYNNQLVKRGELLISPRVLGFEEKHEQEKKRGRPFTYPEPLIRVLLFIKFALGLPYRQTQGLAQKLLSLLGIKVPNFKTPHYRFSKMNINLQDFPEPQELPDDFVLILDSTGLKVTNRGEWLRKKHGKRARKGWQRRGRR